MYSNLCDLEKVGKETVINEMADLLFSLSSFLFCQRVLASANRGQGE